MTRRYRQPETRYPEFVYEDYGLKRNGVPLFMILVLDNPYASKEEKLRFLTEFGYKYIDDENFQKEVDDQVLVFQRNKYVTYTNKNNFQNAGNPKFTKVTVKIGEIDMVGSYLRNEKKINV